MKQHIKIKHIECVQAEFEALKQRKKEKRTEFQRSPGPSAHNHLGVPSIKDNPRSTSSKGSLTNSSGVTPGDFKREWAHGQRGTVKIGRQGRRDSEIFRPNKFVLEPEENEAMVKSPVKRIHSAGSDGVSFPYSLADGMGPGILKLLQAGDKEDSINEIEEEDKKVMEPLNEFTLFENQNQFRDPFGIRAAQNQPELSPSHSWPNIYDSFAQLSLENGPQGKSPERKESEGSFMNKSQNHKESETTASFDEENIVKVSKMRENGPLC